MALGADGNEGGEAEDRDLGAWCESDVVWRHSWRHAANAAVFAPRDDRPFSVSDLTGLTFAPTTGRLHREAQLMGFGVQ
jgi:hypothetical protein